MGLLHRRHDDGGPGAVAEKRKTDRRRDPRRAFAASVPLRNPYADPARGAPRRPSDADRRCVDWPKERPMNGSVMINRRRVLAGTGALVVSFSLSDAFAQDQAAQVAKPPCSLATAPCLDAWFRSEPERATT